MSYDYSVQSWQGVNEFVAVVETGGFSKAARQLEVSTAHVSRSVSSLEKRLAVKLLQRSTRQVNTTAAGQLYFLQCRQLLAALAEANNAVSELNATPRGRIRITAPVYYGEQVIAPLLNEVLREYPDIELDLQLSNHNRDLIAEGFDLAIRLGALASSSLIAKRLGSRSYAIVGSEDYFRRCGKPRTIEQLADHNCLRGISDHWSFADKKEARAHRVTGTWRCNSGLAVSHAAIEGMGIAQLPNYYTAAAIADGRLISVLKKYRPADEGIWAVYPPNHHVSAKLRVVIDYLAEHLDMGLDMGSLS